MPIAPQHLLTSQSELLLRQVIDVWIQEGRPTARAFRPNSNDGGQLSCDRSTVVTPRQAFEAYIAQGRPSAGVWAISVGEFAAVLLQSYSDPLPENAAHALVDYSAHEERDWRRLSKKVYRHAVVRARMYPEEEAA